MRDILARFVSGALTEFPTNPIHTIRQRASGLTTYCLDIQPLSLAEYCACLRDQFSNFNRMSLSATMGGSRSMSRKSEAPL
jgi:hypothetical protein